MNVQTIKKELKRYKDSLKHKAFLDANSKGRRFREDEDSVFFNIMPPFWLDSFKIEHSTAYRRMKDKTQVFSFPENPHIRTRLSHTTEVTWFAMIAAHFLGLNIQLAEVIARGHDIGHTPYGHLGESFISEKTGKKINHATVSVVIAQKIERRGKGLNLSYEALEGILHHSSGDKDVIIDEGLPLEYGLVKWADKIVYLFSDRSDALRAKCIKKNDLPKEFKDLGLDHKDRVFSCLAALIKESSEKGIISFQESETAQKFRESREWMFENVYFKQNHDIQKLALSLMYEFFVSESYFQELDPILPLILMTDREVNKVVSLALQSAKIQLSDVANFGFMEILPNLKGERIDFLDPDLNWEK